MTIRPMSGEDIPKMLEIYRPYVEETTISFEYEAPPLEEFTARTQEVTKRFPWLVCQHKGEVRGYAYACAFRSRSAYQWDAELSVYVDRRFHGRRAGAALYTALLDLLRAMGYCNAYALVTVPNEKSMALHRCMGFTPTGSWRKSGYKMGAWLDVTLLEKHLLDHPNPPKPTCAFSQLPARVVEDILEASLIQLA